MAITAAEGSCQDFGYTGAMQSLVLPQSGLYCLEAWGAGGGGQLGGKGGYAKGYRVFGAGTVICICVGGTGRGWTDYDLYVGGYNGGGNGGCYGWYPETDGKSGSSGYGGGGATHMAATNGELASVEKTSLYIVAGGGGGQTGGSQYIDHNYDSYMGSGGAGGGAEGGYGTGALNASYNGYRGVKATQTGGYAYGVGQNGRAAELGEYGRSNGRGGGGGGYYGGGACRSVEQGTYFGGNGGSGYIGGVPELVHLGTTYSPVNQAGGGSAANANGRARITYVRQGQMPIIFNGVRLTGLVVNGTVVSSAYYDERKLF